MLLDSPLRLPSRPCGSPSEAALDDTEVRDNPLCFPPPPPPPTPLLPRPNGALESPACLPKGAQRVSVPQAPQVDRQGSEHLKNQCRQKQRREREGERKELTESQHGERNITFVCNVFGHCSL